MKQDTSITNNSFPKLIENEYYVFIVFIFIDQDNQYCHRKVYSLFFKVVLRLTMCDMSREYFTICVDKVLGWGQVSLLPQTS